MIKLFKLIINKIISFLNYSKFNAEYDDNLFNQYDDDEEFEKHLPRMKESDYK